MSAIDPAEIQERMEAMSALAGLLAHYAEALVSAGFSRDEAMRLTLDHQMVLIGGEREGG